MLMIGQDNELAYSLDMGQTCAHLSTDAFTGGWRETQDKNKLQKTKDRHHCNNLIPEDATLSRITCVVVN